MRLLANLTALFYRWCKMNSLNRRSFVALLLLAQLPLLSACGPSSSDKAAASAEAPPIVSTVKVAATSLPRIQEFPGRLASTRVSEVRAQVSGIVLERAFVEGSDVAQGDTLFRINAAVYQAEVESRAAAVDRAEATRVQAARQSERTQLLLDRQATSTAQNDVSVAALKQAEADVASAKAQLDRARINLDFATVRAPIAGRIGRALVTEGALVGQNEPTHLATIQQIDPIYVDFTQSVSDPGFLPGRANSVSSAEVRLIRGDGSIDDNVGQLLFSDVSVDPGTAQVTLRAKFSNPKGALLPGTYVRVRVATGNYANAAVIPPQAIQRSSAGEAQAFVVDSAGKVAVKPLRTGPLTAEGWVVLEGLSPGETVVVEGFQKIRPGSVVKPQPWKGPSSDKQAEAR